MNWCPINRVSISLLKGTVWAINPTKRSFWASMPCGHLQVLEYLKPSISADPNDSVCLKLILMAPQAPSGWPSDFSFLSDPEFGRAFSWGPSVVSVSLLPPSASLWSVLYCASVVAPWPSSSSDYALYSEHPAVQGSDKDKTQWASEYADITFSF